MPVQTLAQSSMPTLMWIWTCRRLMQIWMRILRAAIWQELPETSAAAPVDPGLTGWLGLGKMPFLIWLASMCLSFGLTGLGLQTGLRDLMGFVLPPALASLPALGAALWFTRGFGAWFARVLPQTETSALSERSLGRQAWGRHPRHRRPWSPRRSAGDGRLWQCPLPAR